jgi:thymidylate synthase
VFFRNLVKPVYGYLWRSFGGHYPERDGIDQVARLVGEINRNPNSRRLIVTGWDPRYADNVELPPCHTLFQFKVQAERVLHCQLYQRSADAFLGVPFNISSYALLMHLIAHACGLEVGEFVYTLGDYHIYQNHLEQVEELLSRQPLPLPKLQILDEGKKLRGLEGLLNMRYEHLALVGYKSHRKIAGQVAV